MIIELEKVNIAKTGEKKKKEETLREIPNSLRALASKDEFKEPLLVDSGYDETTQEIKKHDAEPLKRAEDIEKVSQYLIENGRFKENLLFIAGINFGLRIGDLLRLKVGDLVEPDWSSYREKVIVEEEKSGKVRTLFTNEAICEAATLYLEDLARKGKPLDRNSYLFTPPTRNHGERPMAVRTVNDWFPKLINEECGINIRASTHTIRKTFAYHIIMSSPDRSRAVEFLQKIFNHSSQSVTLHYAGITDDEIKGAYQSLNLGLSIAKSSGYTKLA